MCECKNVLHTCIHMCVHARMHAPCTQTQTHRIKLCFVAYNSEQRDGRDLARVLQERSAVDNRNELTQLLHKNETS